MPLVIPVFIPHEGCPHACIFCDQHRISGRKGGVPVSPAEVRQTIVTWLGRSSRKRAAEVQIAFYGGSFTGLSITRQEELLKAAEPFLQDGSVRSLRLSTRPDYIDGEKVAFLRRHGVTTVELGLQSLDDRVLAASGRGHTADQSRRAMELLRDSGMEMGLQLMLGLPGQGASSLMRTAKEAAAMKPAFVRIYPVLVLRESGLHSLYTSGKYKPLSLGKAVIQAAWMKKYFQARGIRVVRVGLQPGPELVESLVAGPYHPAFGELVSSRIMLQETRKILHLTKGNAPQVLSISASDESIFRGVNSRNIKRLRELGLEGRYHLVTDRSQPRFTVRPRGAAAERVNDAQWQ